MILKTVKFLCKIISPCWYTYNRGIQIHYRCFLRSLKESGKTLNKLHLTIILKITFFDHHPIT